MKEIRDETGELMELQICAQDFVQAGFLSPGGIILPGHPCHDATLSQNLPPGWAEQADSSHSGAFVFSMETGLMIPASEDELTDYLYGGEYDDRLSAIGETDQDFDTTN